MGRKILRRWGAWLAAVLGILLGVGARADTPNVPAGPTGTGPDQGAKLKQLLREARTKRSGDDAEFREAVQKCGPMLTELKAGTEVGKPIWHDIQLNAAGESFDIIKIRTPDDVPRDLQWVFVIPSNSTGCKEWYIVPTKGTMTGFSVFHTATPLQYETPSGMSPVPAESLMFVQGLAAANLKPGQDYLIWFGFDPGAKDPIRCRLAINFTPARPDAEKSVSVLETSLGLVLGRQFRTVEAKQSKDAELARLADHADALLAARKWDAALAILDPLVKVHADDQEILVIRAFVQANRKQWDAARADLERADKVWKILPYRADYPAVVQQSEAWSNTLRRMTWSEMHTTQGDLSKAMGDLDGADAWSWTMGPKPGATSNETAHLGRLFYPAWSCGLRLRAVYAALGNVKQVSGALPMVIPFCDELTWEGRCGRETGRFPLTQAELEAVLHPLSDLIAKQPKAAELTRDTWRDVAELYRTRARVYVYLGQLDKAVEDLSRVRELAGEDMRATLVRAVLCYRLGRIEEALKDFRALYDKAEDTDVKKSSKVSQEVCAVAWQYLTWILATDPKHGDAREACALVRDPAKKRRPRGSLLKNPDFWRGQLLEVLTLATENQERAEILALAIGSPNPGEDGAYADGRIAMKGLGGLLLQEKTVPDALEKWQKVLGVNPWTVFTAFDWRKIVEMKRPATLPPPTDLELRAEKAEKAQAWCGAVELMPNESHAANNLAWLYVTNRWYRNPVRALELARMAAQDHTAATLDTLAAAYAENLDFENAAKTEREALTLAKDPKDAEEFKARIKLFEDKWTLIGAASAGI